MQEKIPELINQITALKARETDLEKEKALVHDRLVFLIGKVEGYQEALSDIKKDNQPVSE